MINDTNLHTYRVWWRVPCVPCEQCNRATACKVWSTRRYDWVLVEIECRERFLLIIVFTKVTKVTQVTSRKRHKSCKRQKSHKSHKLFFSFAHSIKFSSCNKDLSLFNAVIWLSFCVIDMRKDLTSDFCSHWRWILVFLCAASPDLVL